MQQKMDIKVSLLAQKNIIKLKRISFNFSFFYLSVLIFVKISMTIKLNYLNPKSGTKLGTCSVVLKA